jgi:hypothetical protein
MLSIPGSTMELVKASIQAAEFKLFEVSLLAKLLPSSLPNAKASAVLTSSALIKSTAFHFQLPPARTPPREALDFSTRY